MSSRDLQVEVMRHVRAWAPSRAEIRSWAHAALGRHAPGRELAVRVVGASESRRLNARYRGRSRPTNVLSFPAPSLPDACRASGLPRPLGDLVICPDVLRAEARDQGKSLRAHWAHLVVHGVLHLIGYDHVRADEASRMERREIAVLRRLGFANPYRSV